RLGGFPLLGEEITLGGGERLDPRCQGQQMALTQGGQKSMALKNPQDSTFAHGTPHPLVDRPANGMISILDNPTKPARWQLKCQSDGPAAIFMCQRHERCSLGVGPSLARSS